MDKLESSASCVSTHAKQKGSCWRCEMDETVSDGKMQYKVLDQDGIEVLLGIIDVIDDLDDWVSL